MNQLFLEDLANLTDTEVREHIASDYEVELSVLEPFEILLAYESVGNYGCDSSSFFVIKDIKTKELFEVNGGHCSCYGFEGQWTPEKTTVEYLNSDKFSFYNGGYDGDSEGNKEKVLEFVRELAKDGTP